MHASTALPFALVPLLLAQPAAAADPVAETSARADALAAGEKARAEGVPDLGRTHASSAPAFVLLGVSPSQVERPTTPADVVASVGSILGRGSEGLVPDGVALEVAPYWLVPAWGLTWEDLNRQWWASVYRTLSLSVATLSTPDPSSVSDTSLALGVRTQLVPGRPRNDCARAVEAYRAIARELTQALVLPPEVLRELAERHGVGTPAFDAAVARLQAERRAPFDARLPRIHEACDAAGRVGLVVDLSGAFSWRFPRSTWKEGHRESGAAWLTAAWLSDAWSVVAMARWEGRSLAATPARSLDAGLRAIVQRERYAASLEGVLRRTWDGEAETRGRLAILAEYRIAGDTWISVAFGRDELVSDAGAIFTSANLRWAFGQRGFPGG